MLHNMWHTCQLIMIVSLDIVNNNKIRCHGLGFCNLTGTFIYFKTIKLAIAATLVVNVHAHSILQLGIRSYTPLVT